MKQFNYIPKMSITSGRVKNLIKSISINMSVEP